LQKPVRAEAFGFQPKGKFLKFQRLSGFKTPIKKSDNAIGQRFIQLPAAISQ
jgi:hypothetical protein